MKQINLQNVRFYFDKTHLSRGNQRRDKARHAVRTAPNTSEIFTLYKIVNRKNCRYEFRGIRASYRKPYATNNT